MKVICKEINCKYNTDLECSRGTIVINLDLRCDNCSERKGNIDMAYEFNPKTSTTSLEIITEYSECKDNKLIMMVGLPRSGKSTIAKSLDIPIVDTDGIRKALGVFPFIAESETVVWMIAKYMVRALFFAGHTEVVLDATNLTKQSRVEWKSNLYDIVYYPVTTPVEVCIERAVKNEQYELIPIIERMSKAVEWPDENE